jgi:hypothetical protein
MSKNVVVRYRTRPDAAEENARLVAAVFAELSEVDPGGLHYTTYGSTTASPSSTSHASTVRRTR